jgi:hypothetical protein
MEKIWLEIDFGDGSEFKKEIPTRMSYLEFMKFSLGIAEIAKYLPDFSDKQEKVMKTEKHVRKHRGYKLFTPEMESDIIELLKTGRSAIQIAKQVNSKYGARLRRKQIYDKIHNMKQRSRLVVNKRMAHSRNPLFSDNMVTALVGMHDTGVSVDEIVKSLNLSFGSNLTSKQIRDKIYNLKYTKKWPQNQPDSEKGFWG